MQGPIDLRYDASVYYILGTSLYQGKGYRLLNEPGEIEAIQYPPLLPALVAAHQLVLGTDDPLAVGTALRRTFLLFNLLVVLLAFVYGRLRVGIWIGLAVGALTALNLHTYFLSDLLFTEIPFALLTLSFLVFAESEKRWSAVVTPLLAWAAFLLRTSGVALLAAWVVDAVLRKRFRAAAVRALIAAIPILAWQIYVHRVQASDEYRNPAYSYQRAPSQFYNVTYGANLSLKDPFRPEQGQVTSSHLAKRVLQNIVRLPLTLGEGATFKLNLLKWPIINLEKGLGLSPNNRPWSLLNRLLIVVPIALGILALVGGVVMLGDTRRLPALYCGAAIALICTAPWPEQNPRYLAPLIPILALALLQGVRSVSDRMKRVWPGARIFEPKFSMAGIVTFILVVQSLDAYLTYEHSLNDATLRNPRGDERRASYFYFDDSWKGFEKAVYWIAAEVNREAIVATTSPHPLYLQTGNRSVMPPFEAKSERLLESLDNVPVDYVLVDAVGHIDVARHYAEPALRSAPDRWRPVYEDKGGKVTIYGRVRPSAESESGAAGSSRGSNSRT
jgi:hypothetical protein